MPCAQRIYRCTQAGLKAWQSPHSGLPAHYRRILGILEWLGELDTLGLLESSPASEAHDLDFTAHLA